MTEELLTFYNAELIALQKEACVFSEQQPELAALLGINPESIKDPLVKHLVQSFAFLSARARHRFKQEQNTLNNCLLKTIAPQLEYPMPSFSIVEFKLRNQSKKPVQIPKNSRLVIKGSDDLDCEFRTIYSSEILALETRSIRYTLFEKDSQLDMIIKANASISTPHKIRFYINQNLSNALKLHQLIFEHLSKLLLINGNGEEFELEAPRQLGFDDSESLLPYENHVLRSHRLLQEFFNYPEKFLFFELSLPDELLIMDEFQLKFHFIEKDDSLNTLIHQNSLRINCCPVINLCKEDTEAIRLNYQEKNYPLLINQSAQLPKTIYKIEKVYGLNDRAEKTEFFPSFHSSFKAHNAREIPRWEHIRTTSLEDNIDLLSLDPKPERMHSLVYCEVLCCNQDYPAHKINRLSSVSLKEMIHSDIERIEMVSDASSFTSSGLTHTPELQLIQHLNINHLFSTEHSQEALFSLFKIYNHNKHPYLNQLINAITQIEVSRQWKANDYALKIKLSFNKKTSLASTLLKTLIKHLLEDYKPINLTIDLNADE